MNNIVKASAGPNAQNRYRFRINQEELSFLAQQDRGMVVLDMENERYLAVLAYALMNELERTKTPCFGGVYFFELDGKKLILYREGCDDVLECEEVVGNGAEFRIEHVLEYTKDNGIYRLKDREVGGDNQTAQSGINVTQTYHPFGLCFVNLARIQYAAREGYQWIFGVWQENRDEPEGGSINYYSGFSRDILRLILENRLKASYGGHYMYVRYANGDVCTTDSFENVLMRLTPVLPQYVPDMRRAVPAIMAENGDINGQMNNDDNIDDVCRLMDESFRRGADVHNRLIIYIILFYAWEALGEKGMLGVLQEMETRGRKIPWAYDATDVDVWNGVLHDRLANGVHQRRYYDLPIRVCNRTYYISSQWYSHVQHPNQEQTKKALLQMICRRIPGEYVGEYMERLIQRARREKR